MSDNKESNGIVYSRNTVEFVTVAAEFCAYIEQSEGRKRRDFVSTVLKLLPLLYLKASLLEKIEGEEDFFPEDFVTEHDYEFIRFTLSSVMAEHDDYLDLANDEVRFSDESVVKNISEDLADIYQSVKNFVETFTSFSKKPFPVSGWTPAKGYPPVKETEELDEFILKDKSGVCKIKYLSPLSSLEGWYITVQNAVCAGDFLQGPAIVSIYTQNDILYQTIKGFFNNGSLVNSYELALPFSFRRGKHADRQKAYTLVHSNADLRIYTFIESDAVLNGEYMPFESCKPFRLYFLTENEYFFTQEDILPNLISVGKSYAQTLCPSVEEVILNATNDPLLRDENVFYRLHLKRDGFNPWQTQKTSSFNKASSQINERQQEDNKKAARMHKDYELLKTSSFNEKLAFLYDRKKLDALPNFLKAAELSGQEVTGVFLVQLPDTDSKGKWIVWPKEALRVENMPDMDGWMLVKGSITPLSRLEKRRAGIAFNQPAGEIKILSYKSCVRPYCAEFDDPLYLLKYYYNLSEWMPEK